MVALINIFLNGIFTFFLTFIINIFNKFRGGIWTVFSMPFRIAFITASVTFFVALASFFTLLYKFIMNFFDLINGYIANTGSEIVNVGFSVLKSVGFFEALSDSTAVFLPVIFSLFSLTALRIIMNIHSNRNNVLSSILNKLDGGDSKSGKNRHKRVKK